MWIDPLATHLPMLAASVATTTGPVLEIGCGFYSTNVLRQICRTMRRELWTVELAYGWARFLEAMADDNHKVSIVESWDDFDVEQQRWAVVLVDHSPIKRRIVDIERVRRFADLIVVHDVESAAYGYGPVLETFPHRYHYKALRPETMVVSDTIDLQCLGPECRRNWRGG